MSGQYRLIVRNKSQGLVYEAVQYAPFLAFSVGDHIDRLEDNKAGWTIESISHSIFLARGYAVREITLTVTPD